MTKHWHRLPREVEVSHLTDSEKPSRHSSGQLAVGGQASSPKEINEDFGHWKLRQISINGFLKGCGSRGG